MGAFPEISARAIVVGMEEHGGDTDPSFQAWRLTLTVMPDDARPFRCRICAHLPVDASWGVRVGVHVPVWLRAGSTAIALDVAGLAGT